MMLSGKVIHLSQQQRKWNAKAWWKMKMESISENDSEIMQKEFQDSLCFLCSFRQSFREVTCTGGDDPAHLKEFFTILPKAWSLFCLHCWGKEFP